MDAPRPFPVQGFPLRCLVCEDTGLVLLGHPPYVGGYRFKVCDEPGCPAGAWHRARLGCDEPAALEEAS